MGTRSWSTTRGVISPLLSNIYLNPLDHMMAQAGHEMVRYADDVVVLCRSEEEARQALERVQQWTAKAGLTLHPEKTRIVSVTEGPTWAAEGFDFLGFHLTCGGRTPRAKSLKKIRDTIRQRTPRSNGHCLTAIIKTLNRSLRGWFNYFRASEARPFRDLDRMIRRRLRAILSKRAKKKGPGTGWANMRWTNAFFKKHGLLSLLELHAEYRQSLRGTR